MRQVAKTKNSVSTSTSMVPKDNDTAAPTRSKQPSESEQHSAARVRAIKEASPERYIELSTHERGIRSVGH